MSEDLIMKYQILLLFTLILTGKFAGSEKKIYELIQLNYDTSSECFNTGIKRVFIPFPGLGTFACAKDVIKQLPDYQKSGNLLAGHIVGLLVSSCIVTATLIVGLNVGIPGCKEILGATLANYFKIKSTTKECK